MTSLPLNNLCNSSTFIKWARLLNLRAIGDQFLLHIPWVMKTDTGVKYRLDRVEAFFLAEGFFWKKHFDAMEKYNLPFKSFADLGANRGFFTLYLVHLARQRGLSIPHGICIDANLSMIKVAESNYRRNHLENIFLEHGVVGVEKNGSSSTADFFLSHSDMESSFFCEGKKVSIPILHIENIWNKYFQGESCQLLKLDIEGSESSFLNIEKGFMKKVQSAIIEFHEPMSLRKDIEKKMSELGFEWLGYEAGPVRPLQLGALYFKRKG